MTEFEVKAITTSLKNKFPQLSSLNISKKENNSGSEYNQIQIQITIDGEIYNTGMTLDEDHKNKSAKIEKKINYAITAAKCTKDGLSNYNITEENIRWDMRSNGQEVYHSQEEDFKLYCRAFQNAAGGTWEAIIALKILREAGRDIEIEDSRIFFKVGNVLEENIREKLEAINFYKRVKEKSRKTKIKRFIDELLPPSKRKLMNNYRY